MTVGGDELPSAESLGLSRVVHVRDVDSTMDLAHELAAAGAPAGTLIVADHQRRGRGRGGHRWASEALGGVWMTLVDRPSDQRVVGVLALRLGLALAEALQPLVDTHIALKWPNDVLAGGKKLAGILVEARWRESAVDWVAIGIGINLAVPESMPDAACVRSGVTRAMVLEAVLPGVRSASCGDARLSPTELDAWARRDWARGRDIDEPVRGRVMGIDAEGALLVAPSAQSETPLQVRSGSLRLRSEAFAHESGA